MPTCCADNSNNNNRPKEFGKTRYEDEEDESDSNVGKMPPSDSEDEY